MSSTNEHEHRASRSPIKFATAAEVAEVLRLSPKTLANWRSKGLGPKYVRIGSRILYDGDEFETWLATKKVDTADFTSGPPPTAEAKKKVLRRAKARRPNGDIQRRRRI